VAEHDVASLPLYAQCVPCGGTLRLMVGGTNPDDDWLHYPESTPACVRVAQPKASTQTDGNAGEVQTP